MSKRRFAPVAIFTASCGTLLVMALDGPLSALATALTIGGLLAMGW